MSITDDEMLEVFVQESREHLENLEPDLLSLEENPTDKDTINRIFRCVHSLKGTSGFFGLDNISNLAHSMENLMSLVRDEKIVLNSAMLDVLLAGKDKLNIMVDDPGGSSAVDIVPEVNALEPFISGDQSVEEIGQAKQDEAKVLEESKERAPDLLKSFRLDPKEFKKAKDDNEHIYVLRVKSISDIRLKNRTPLDFFKDIEALGNFIDSHTDLSPIQGLDNASDAELEFIFLFSAPMERDLIAGAFDMNPDQVMQVDAADIDEIASLDKPREAAPPPEKVPEPKKVEKPEAPKPAAKEAAPATNPKAPLKPGAGKQLVRKKADETVRVSVPVLDELMTLAGEMVLGRNQLMRLAGPMGKQVPVLPGVVQNINVVTTELQEKVMQTRLQPIGSILGKFTRIIRDLGAKLEKDIELEISGKEVELDRSILEAISDPLTHLIRNCADHAIEKPADRETAGKKRRGTVRLIARHAGGQVHVEIIDDGRGLDPELLRRKAVEKGVLTADEVDKMSDRQAQNIIFLPGFSSAEKVSEVSGRGVGMDVVKTNIENLGGSLELESKLGKGTRICLKLPLTLAIVPAMIVLTGGHRFAVPQVNLEEVVNLDGKHHKIEMVRGTPVLRLRSRLLPLVGLRDLLNIPDTIDQKGGKIEKGEDPRKDKYIMVLNTDQHQYGLIVDDLLNIEEIVVKPLSRYLQHINCYSGATILGDGKVALILDTTGMTDIAKVDFDHDDESDEAKLAKVENMRVGEAQSLLIFRNTEHERFAINLAMVARIEKIKTKDIDKVGTKEYIKYLGGSLRLLRLHQYIPIAKPGPDPEHLYVIVPNLVRHPMGIVATEVIDAIETVIDLDHESVGGSGILGSAIISGNMTLFVDIYGLFEEADPEHYKHPEPINVLADKRILLAEDTPFFRTVVYQYLKDFCRSIDVAKHGLEAWEILSSGEKQFDLLLTDVEMPHMDGFELTERVRASEAPLKDLPIVAVTALSAEKYRQRGKAAGVDAYETKLDKEQLRETLERIFGAQSQPRELADSNL